MSPLSSSTIAPLENTVFATVFNKQTFVLWYDSATYLHVYVHAWRALVFQMLSLFVSNWSFIHFVGCSVVYFSLYMLFFPVVPLPYRRPLNNGEEGPTNGYNVYAKLHLISFRFAQFFFSFSHEFIQIATVASLSRNLGYDINIFWWAAEFLKFNHLVYDKPSIRGLDGWGWAFRTFTLHLGKYIYRQ